MGEQSFDYESGRQLSLQHDDANVLILDFPVSGTVTDKFLIYKLLILWNFVIAAPKD